MFSRMFSQNSKKAKGRVIERNPSQMNLLCSALTGYKIQGVDGTIYRGLQYEHPDSPAVGDYVEVTFSKDHAENNEEENGIPCKWFYFKKWRKTPEPANSSAIAEQATV